MPPRSSSVQLWRYTGPRPCRARAAGQAGTTRPCYQTLPRGCTSARPSSCRPARPGPARKRVPSQTMHQAHCVVPRAAGKTWHGGGQALHPSHPSRTHPAWPVRWRCLGRPPWSASARTDPCLGAHPTPTRTAGRVALVPWRCPAVQPGCTTWRPRRGFGARPSHAGTSCPDARGPSSSLPPPQREGQGGPLGSSALLDPRCACRCSCPGP
mmetsp:Transcript_28232/g.70872  ORF Transcript_28232/g.70872 Transcript_28232/m.70872 type:complete len:211 (+) Transcript_28232:525-1157(+)